LLSRHRRAAIPWWCLPVAQLSGSRKCAPPNSFHFATGILCCKSCACSGTKARFRPGRLCCSLPQSAVRTQWYSNVVSVDWWCGIGPRNRCVPLVQYCMGSWPSESLQVLIISLRCDTVVATLHGLNRRLVAGGALFPRAGPPAAGRWTLGSADFGRPPGAAGYCRQICLTQTRPVSVCQTGRSLYKMRWETCESAILCRHLRGAQLCHRPRPLLSAFFFNGRASPVGDRLRECVLPSLFSCADNFNFGALHCAPG
jgi:hypothetical protein